MGYYAFANLPETDLSAIKELETRIGKPLVALKPVELEAAPVDDGTLSAIRDLESKLGVALLAVSS